MNERAATPDAKASATAARTAALAPWAIALAELKRWFDDHGRSIWHDDAAAQAEQRVALLRDLLEALGSGDDAIGSSSRARAAKASAAAAPRIDALLAGKRAAKPTTTPSPALAERRRKALLNLALWDALRGLQAAGTEPPLSRLHARLVEPAATAPGLSPALDYSQTAPAREFFEQSVRRVLQALATRCGSDGDGYARLVPTQPFDAGLPSLVAWSQAWSAAVAGVYLDYLQRHAGDDVQRALRELWAGQLDAVRFRAGAGLTALPAHAGSLHLDLWTCTVKAQALAFDAARWPQRAAGTCWHGVRIDMHELGRGANNSSQAGAAASGLGIETLYRVVFVDRLRVALDAAGPRLDAAVAIDGTVADAGEHTITIEMNRPRPGHLPNLKLLLRWRDPGGEPLRFAGASPETTLSAADRQALQGLIEHHADAALSRVLDARALDWRAAVSARVADETGVAPAALGDGLLWPALDAAVQWIDPALLVRCDGRWYELPVQLDAAADGRTCWLLAQDAAWPPHLDLQRLRDALATADAVIWLVHETGLGAFVMAAVDAER